MHKYANVNLFTKIIKLVKYEINKAPNLLVLNIIQ